MRSEDKTRVGVIGCGVISGIYLEAPKKFDVLEIAAVADLDMERAKARAEQYNVPKACTVEELLADPSIDVVIDLTIPKAHAGVNLSILEAGKSVYSEKPLATSLTEAAQGLKVAREKGLRVGCAPDTFLGAGLQTCRKLIDDGWIGQPLAATAFMLSAGPEKWHPDPEFFYQPGAGPLFDMGPYYLTALVSLLGPVVRVTGSAQALRSERTITSEPKYGSKIKVNTPTHVAGVFDFANGVVSTLITSFDTWYHQLPRIEIYGTEGTLSVPDPNTFGGPVKIRRAGAENWSEIPLAYNYATNSRGLGLADMAYAIKSGRAHRASGELAYHILDAMQAVYDASCEGQHIYLKSTCARPEPLPIGLVEGKLDF
ncbi:MAG TPA: Gfo/Idh/MocA family oxidoreductase [Chloroflexia bacterium]|nr:Gfo/Idh/MocA family oxidoreductase [Chloroflexia bacterium]